MAPRGFWKTFAIFALLTAPVYGVSMALFFSFMRLFATVDVARFLRDVAMSGVPFGFFFGLAMGALYRGIVLTVPFSELASFKERIRRETERKGYRHAVSDPTYWRFQPGFKAGLMSGDIEVRFEERIATIVGPRWHVRKILERVHAP